MRKSIVVRLFLFTIGLSMFILASIYVGQTILFENYYINNKIKQLTEAIGTFKVDYQNIVNDHTMNQIELEQQFYQENNAWITVLDENGYVKGTTEFAVTLIESYVTEDDDDINYSDLTYVIPIAYLINAYNENEEFDFMKETEEYLIEIHGIEKKGEVFPYEVIISTLDSIYDVHSPFYLFEGGLDNVSYWKNQTLATKIEETNSNEGMIEKVIYGNVHDVKIPNYNNHFFVSTRQNLLFFERIKEFQAELILGDLPTGWQATKEIEYEENGINYRVLIDESKDENGETIYFFTMASLQPIDEAVEMMEDYFVYLIIAVGVLILLAAFYFSRKIASPLLKINTITKRIAHLDFAEKAPVKSNDEIGQLAENINILSDTLHAHIQTLQQDIEKERQLENTRKEFIAGVSHELKTPLSIMKSCMSILQDEVAVDKRAHYFSAMNQEVNRMDRLIVDMLELAKYESGTYKMNMEAFFINDLINNVYQQLVIKIDNKRLIVDLQLQSIEVFANEHRIEQVVTNFLTNAIFHTQEEGNIAITTVEEANRVKVSVENEGSQIDQNQLEKIWDRFYRSEKNQRSKEGTGLGLAISKNILILHNAEYGVKNTESGVQFYFYLNKK